MEELASAPKVTPGYVYTLDWPGIDLPFYVGSTVNPAARKLQHSYWESSRVASSRIIQTLNETNAGDFDFKLATDQIVGVDQDATNWLTAAFERGFIAEYRDTICNIRSGGISQTGANAPMFGVKMSDDSKLKMRKAWTPARREAQRNRLLGAAKWQKISEAQAVEIRNSSDSNRTLAKKYGVHEGTIWRIRKGYQHAGAGGSKFSSKRLKHGKYSKSNVTGG